MQVYFAICGALRLHQDGLTDLLSVLVTLEASLQLQVGNS
jgi:hypothetical protein